MQSFAFHFKFLRSLLWALGSVALPSFAGGQSVAYDPPSAYYAAAANKTGTALETSLHGIIASHTVLTYTPGVWDALEVLDADLSNSANVLLIYSGLSSPISSEYHGGDSTGTWDREHLWCQSYFANDTKIKTDVFNLRPADYTANDVRNNLYYDFTTLPGSTLTVTPGSSYDTDSWEPRNADKGAIARAVFYMAVCYDGTAGGVSTTKLVLAETASVSTNTFGRLSTLLAWNRQYPVTETERRRNQLIYSNYQRNRNPFVDNRYLADLVFGGATSAQNAWLRTRFTTAELANTAVSGDQAAPARDGISNLLKYAFNLDPKLPSAAGLPVGGISRVGTVTYLTLTHLKNRQASELTWRYQSSVDLITWTDVTPTVLSTAHLDADATDLVSVGVPVTGTSRYLRLLVSKP